MAADHKVLSRNKHTSGEQHLQVLCGWSEPQYRPTLGIPFHYSAVELRSNWCGTPYAGNGRTKTTTTMLRWVVTFLVIALVAALFGFGGLAAGAAEIAKIIFYIFLVLLVISLIFGSRIWPKNL